MEQCPELRKFDLQDIRICPATKRMAVRLTPAEQQPCNQPLDGASGFGKKIRLGLCPDAPATRRAKRPEYGSIINIHKADEFFFCQSKFIILVSSSIPDVAFYECM